MLIGLGIAGDHDSRDYSQLRRQSQFRVLYREFLFRVVDVELLSGNADMNKLLGQFAALLIFFGLLLSFAASGVGDAQLPRAVRLINGWGMEHFAIHSKRRLCSLVCARYSAAVSIV